MERIFTLRDTIALAEGTKNHGAGRSQPAAEVVALGDGVFSLDGALGGGLRRCALHEIRSAGARHAAAAAGFAVALAVRCADGAPLVWIVEDAAARETGLPYRPGLTSHGLVPDRLVLVRTRDTRATLWATEEALRAGVRVVITELWRASAYDLAASRRLLFAARRGQATSLLLHVGLGERDELSSAADTRFAVAAASGPHRAPASGHATPIPGLPGFAVRLTKLRGATSGHDRDRIHTLAWDRGTRRFRTAGQGSAFHPANAGPAIAEQDHVA